MTEIELKDLRIQEEVSLGGLSVAVEKVGDNKVFRPLTITENGTYDGGEEDGKFIGYTPVTVDVKLERPIKKYIDSTGDPTGLLKGLQFTDMTLFVEYNDTENATNMNSFYQNCTYSNKYPLLNTSKATSMYYMHNNNYEMVELPAYDTKNVGDFQYFCGNCRNMKKVPLLDVRAIYTFTGAFVGCTSLEEIWLKNIAANLQVGSGDTYGHLIKVECLINLIYELRQRKGKCILTIGNVNLEKLANVYVRTIDITDEMRAEDDLIDEKLPFEVCESTDEGAMWIVDYVTLKNWELR